MNKEFRFGGYVANIETRKNYFYFHVAGYELLIYKGADFKTSLELTHNACIIAEATYRHDWD